MSKRRGKRKKGRGPRPPKPPHKRSVRKKSPEDRGFRVLEGGSPDAAEIAAWNANVPLGDPEDGFEDGSEVWDEEGMDTEAVLKEWDEMAEIESALADLLGEFHEAHPDLGSLNRLQATFEAVCINEVVEKEDLSAWAAGIVNRIADPEAVSPSVICEAFGLEPARLEEWTQRVTAAEEVEW